MAIPSRSWKNPVGYRQHAEAELVFINMEKCNFLWKKFEVIAKLYFSITVIYFKKVYKGLNWEIEPLKCFSTKAACSDMG